MQLYLSSGEYDIFDYPKKVLSYKKMRLDNRNILVVIISEPILGQEYGLGGLMINTLYLVNREKEEAFEKLSAFPISVHVLIIRDAKKQMPISLADMQSIAWASLYNNFEDAKMHKYV